MPATTLTKVLPGRRVEIQTPQYEEGETVQVSVEKPASLHPQLILSPEEWNLRYQAYVESHDNMRLPDVPEDAFHRASWYEDHD